MTKLINGIAVKNNIGLSIYMVRTAGIITVQVEVPKTKALIAKFSA